MTQFPCPIAETEATESTSALHSLICICIMTLKCLHCVICYYQAGLKEMRPDPPPPTNSSWEGILIEGWLDIVCQTRYPELCASLVPISLYLGMIIVKKNFSFAYFTGSDTVHAYLGEKHFVLNDCHDLPVCTDC